jgi:putative cell wall-binding protein
MRRALVVALLACLSAVAGCAGLNEKSSTKKGKAPQISAKSTDKSAATELGFPVSASKNTTRVPGGDAAADVAGAVSAVFPSTGPDNRPHAVAVVDTTNWQGVIAAGVLMAKPLGIPTLLSSGGNLPTVSNDTLARLKPPGSPLAGNAQIIRIGDNAGRPSVYRKAIIPGSDPYVVAAGVDKFFSAARGKPSSDVIVTSGEQAGYAMPAAAWAARSGDSALFVRQGVIPEATRQALATHDKPNIWVLGPPSAVGPAVISELRKLGKVQRVQGPTPVQNAIAFTKFGSHGFGWDISTPGQNFTLASTTRPSDAAGSAALAGGGVFAPLLLTDVAQPLPPSLDGFFQDVQPGYQGNPNSGVFNHVWILGDDSTVSVGAQGRIDTITQLVPVEAQNP